MHVSIYQMKMQINLRKNINVRLLTFSFIPSLLTISLRGLKPFLGENISVANKSDIKDRPNFKKKKKKLKLCGQGGSAVLFAGSS